MDTNLKENKLNKNKYKKIKDLCLWIQELIIIPFIKYKIKLKILINSNISRMINYKIL